MGVCGFETRTVTRLGSIVVNNKVRRVLSLGLVKRTVMEKKNRHAGCWKMTICTLINMLSINIPNMYRRGGAL